MQSANVGREMISSALLDGPAAGGASGRLSEEAPPKLGALHRPPFPPRGAVFLMARGEPRPM